MQLEFMADFGKDLEAQRYAEDLQAKYKYADVVIFDAEKNLLNMVLPGKRTRAT